jgi:signal transduction histidine kinase
VTTRTWDALVALAVLLAGAAEILLAPDVPGHRAAAALLLVAMCAPLLVRRTHPLPAVAALCALGIAQAALVTDVSDVIGLYFPLLILAYSAAAYARFRPAAGALALLLGTAVAIETLDHQAGNAIFPMAVVTLCWLGGRNVRARTRLAAELHEAAARAAEEREARAAQAVADERRRIAREMHDVVAHSISIMVVQAGGARSILALDAERAAAAVARIRQTGADALAEMHTLLGVLDAPAGPSLDALPDLVERARHAGLPVTLAVVGTPRALPRGGELAAYRVVQEALTNAIKHAGGAPTGVQLVWGDAELELRIADRGAGGLAPELEGGGHGLVGMRERVRPFGGEVSAGRRAAGGYEVVARIPLGATTGAQAGGCPATGSCSRYGQPDAEHRRDLPA